MYFKQRVSPTDPIAASSRSTVFFGSKKVVAGVPKLCRQAICLGKMTVIDQCPIGISGPVESLSLIGKYALSGLGIARGLPLS